MVSERRELIHAAAFSGAGEVDEATPTSKSPVHSSTISQRNLSPQVQRNYFEEVDNPLIMNSNDSPCAILVNPQRIPSSETSIAIPLIMNSNDSPCAILVNPQRIPSSETSIAIPQRKEGARPSILIAQSPVQATSTAVPQRKEGVRPSIPINPQRIPINPRRIPSSELQTSVADPQRKEGLLRFVRRAVCIASSWQSEKTTSKSLSAMAIRAFILALSLSLSKTESVRFFTTSFCHRTAEIDKITVEAKESAMMVEVVEDREWLGDDKRDCGGEAEDKRLSATEYVFRNTDVPSWKEQLTLRSMVTSLALVVRCGSLGSVLRSKSRIGLKMGRSRSSRVKMISIIYISFFLVSSAHSIYLPDVAPRDFPAENLGEVLRGGREGVLVRWQLDTDNRFQLLEMSSIKMLRSISGIKLHSSVPERYNGQCSDVVFDSTAGLVSICIENYCVQFFSMLDDREISLVQVCERNHQPDDEVTVIVSMVALSPDGCTMSTVETRLPEEGIGGLVCLKFWKSGSQNKDFSLPTIVYEPHRDAGVSAISFHPTRNMAVNSSYAAEFKIWASNSDVQHGDHMNNAGWTCRAVASYKKKPMTAAAFSSDDSVLTVAAERVITLWDPNRNVLVATIGEIFEPISSLSFIGKSGVE